MTKITGGLDIAMNHSAAVISEDGEPVDWRFLTNKPRVHELTEDGTATLYYCSDKRSADTLWARLSSYYEWISMVMILGHELGVSSWGVEDYAHGRKHNAYHIGEFGGVTRAAVMSAGYGSIELVNIGDVKARAGLRRQSKEKPLAFCLDTWGVDFGAYDFGFSGSDAGGDLADAAVISLIVSERCNT